MHARANPALDRAWLPWNRLAIAEEATGGAIGSGAYLHHYALPRIAWSVGARERTCGGIPADAPDYRTLGDWEEGFQRFHELFYAGQSSLQAAGDRRVIDLVVGGRRVEHDEAKRRPAGIPLSPEAVAVLPAVRVGATGLAV